MKVKTVIIILSIVGLIVSLIWLKNDHSWEPIGAVVTCVIALIAAINSGGNDGNKNISMKQKGGSNSKNLQSGCNININSKL